MKAIIKARFTPEMLADLAGRYATAPDHLVKQDGFESFIYQYPRTGTGGILRVGHSGRRGEALVRGEMDWLDYLANHGANVACPIPSNRGSLVEQISDGQGEYFIAASFQQAPGIPAWEYGWTPALFTAYGKAVGRMHSLTTRYESSNLNGTRPAWDDPEILDVEANLCEIDPLAVQLFAECAAQCHKLPQDRQSFGLIHFDAHAGNFLVDTGEQLTFFDFDDCNYNWFACDLAIVLFYMVMWKDDPAAFTRQFLTHFFAGYRTEHRLDPGWLETMPLFLKMREIDLYGVIRRDFDLENLDDPWVAGYMQGRIERIHGRLPYLDMDFREFRHLL